MELPDGWGIESADFINRLIKRKQNERLGHGGDSEVKNHLWFKGFSWDKLYRRELQSPYIPEEETNKGINYTMPIDNEMVKRYKKIMNSKEYKVAFKKFLFFNLYDKNLYNEKYKNPHEVYEDQLIQKNKIYHDDGKSENENIDKDYIKTNAKDNLIEDKIKSVNQPLKTKFDHMNMFNRNNYNFFEKSQNIPINKYLKDDL